MHSTTDHVILCPVKIFAACDANLFHCVPLKAVRDANGNCAVSDITGGEKGI